MNNPDLQKKYTPIAMAMAVILPICFILAGVGGFKYFKSQKAKMKRRPVKQQAVMVETKIMNPGNYQSTIRVMGTVGPEKQIELKAKVSGEVMNVSKGFVQGGLVEKGQTLLTIDDSDYKIEVKKATAALSKAEADLDIELGSQMIAKEELKLINQAALGEIIATDLSLRKPQLVQARATVESARAELERAKLNLSRTRVVLPFNALVLEKNVNEGSLVSAQNKLAVLVDVDAYRVEALVPPDQLTVLTINETAGSKAYVTSVYSGQTWEGTAARITGKITTNSRMAGVVILIPDPLGFNRAGNNQPLLLDDHVEVKIMAKQLENVYSLSRSFLRDGNTVWIFKNGQLDIRTVELIWKEDGTVFIGSGIEPGDQVITSDLPAPVNGMALQTVPRSQS